MAIGQKMQIKPEMLRWARERAELPLDKMRQKFSRIEEWESGSDSPTLKQLENFAKTVHVPIGYLFLDNPPEEELPIQDFRTIGSSGRQAISVNARDMIYICQRRQDWYRDYAIANAMDKIEFVNSFKKTDTLRDTARKMRAIIKLSEKEQFNAKSIDEFLRILREKIEDAGVLIMISGIVGANTNRPLNIQEFRGFALSDDYAPLIFINGKDSDTGKIFTLAHELAHICLGQTGISDISPQNKDEKWCNAFAAEFLVPMTALKGDLQINTDDIDAEVTSLSKRFKVSRIVMLRRLRYAKLVNESLFQEKWKQYDVPVKKVQKDEKGRGGNYYNTLPVQISKRFLRALYISAEEGSTLYRDALRMVGTNKIETFKTAAKKIERAA